MLPTIDPMGDAGVLPRGDAALDAAALQVTRARPFKPAKTAHAERVPVRVPLEIHFQSCELVCGSGETMRGEADDSPGKTQKVLVETFAVNEAINQLILQHLDPHAWRAIPPGRNARTIAAIFSHVHNIRRKWLRLSAPHLKLPPELDRTKLTQRQASAALAQSAKRCTEMIAEALGNPNGRVTKFRRDGWARPWPAGAAMVAYMLTHEAHHRGQVCMLAHQLGYPLPMKFVSEMWSWERLWKQSGFPGPH